MKNILILGGTGFVGRNLARYFTAQGHTVEAIGSAMNILNGNAFAPIRAKPDLVINCAGWKDVPACEKDALRSYSINAIGAGNVARACRQHGVRLIHISSDHAYATPATVYSESKRLGDVLVRKENPDATIVVTGHVYANDCPWVMWLDGELRAGRKVEAWTDIANYPTHVTDLATYLTPISLMQERTVLCVGAERITRMKLFREYARVFDLDESLIVDGGCAPPWYPRDFDFKNLPSIWTLRPVDGFQYMKGEA